MMSRVLRCHVVMLFALWYWTVVKSSLSMVVKAHRVGRNESDLWFIIFISVLKKWLYKFIRFCTTKDGVPPSNPKRSICRLCSLRTMGQLQYHSLTECSSTTVLSIQQSFRTSLTAHHYSDSGTSYLLPGSTLGYLNQFVPQLVSMRRGDLTYRDLFTEEVVRKLTLNDQNTRKYQASILPIFSNEICRGYTSVAREWVTA